MRYREPVLGDDARRKQIEEWEEINGILDEIGEAVKAAQPLQGQWSPSDPRLQQAAQALGIPGDRIVELLRISPEMEGIKLGNSLLVPGTRVTVGYAVNLAPFKQEALRVRTLAQNRLKLLQMLTENSQGA